MTSIDLHVASRIRHARIYCGVTQQQLADLIHCSPGVIAHLEQNRIQIKVSRLGQIAEALDLPISYFFANFNQTE